VESTFAGGQVLKLSGSCLVLFRPQESSASYCEMVEPEESAGCETSEDGGSTAIRWTLFPDSLEKGVIRRARVRGLILPRQGDEELALACYRAFLASPLVLST
jgi:hypothetical protein